LPLRELDDAAQRAGLFCFAPWFSLRNNCISSRSKEAARAFQKVSDYIRGHATALIAVQLTVLSLCLVFHEPYRFVIGRSLIYRFDWIDRMPTEEKAVYLRKLQTSASDPITKEAIPAVLEAKGYSGDSMRVIKDLIQRHGQRLGGNKLDARPIVTLTRYASFITRSPRQFSSRHTRRDCSFAQPALLRAK